MRLDHLLSKEHLASSTGPGASSVSECLARCSSLVDVDYLFYLLIKSRQYTRKGRNLGWRGQVTQAHCWVLRDQK